MMSAAYFKGKRELLEWVTDFLRMDVGKVEELAKGAHYCQLLDAMFPKTMNMSKVNFGAYLEPDYIKNWKLIQTVFEKQGIQKVIPVDKLVKSRFQDNLEFLQWFYQYFTATYNPSSGYDPVKRRQRSKGTAGLSMHKGPSGATRKRQKADTSRRSSATPSAAAAPRSAAANDPAAAQLKERNAGLKRQVDQLSQDKVLLQDKHHQLEKEYQNVQNVAKEIEKERDFYFQKVVQVEALTKELPDQESDFVKSILKILYATDDASPRPPDDGAADEEMGEM